MPSEDILLARKTALHALRNYPDSKRVWGTTKDPNGNTCAIGTMAEALDINLEVDQGTTLTANMLTQKLGLEYRLVIVAASLSDSFTTSRTSASPWTAYRRVPAHTNVQIADILEESWKEQA